LFYSFFLKLDEKKMESGIFSINELAVGLRLLDSTQNKYDFKNNYLILNKTDTLLDLSDNKAVDRFRDSINQLISQKPGADSLFRKKGGIGILDLKSYASRNEYDSLQKLLPDEKKDSRVTRLLTYRQITINEQYGGDTGKYVANLLDRFLHSFPTLLFISLPLLALLLKLFYLRRKNYLYVNHGIFLIHLYILTFLLLIPFFLSFEVENFLQWKIWTWIRIGIFFWLIAYVYKSMLVFYGQSKGKTISKLILFLFFSLIILINIFILYFAYMALKG
jgi:hypothetical protein